MNTSEVAKLVVTAVTRPTVLAEKVGHGAIDRVVGWFGPEELSRYERLVEGVRVRLKKLPTHELGGPDRVEKILSTAAAHFEDVGLTIDELIRRGLDRQAAINEWDRLRRNTALAHALLTGRITEPAIAVGAIAMDQAARLHCFENAVAAFATRLGRKPRTLAVKPDLGGEHFGAVLMVHMSALATVEGKSLGTARELHDFMLDREARTWQRCLVGPKLGQLDVDDVLQAMAMIVFAGGVEGLEEARALVSRAPRLQHYSPPAIDDLVRLLARLYPRVDRMVGGQDLRVEPLRPDILGERLIERALQRDPRLLEAVFGG